MPSSFMAGRVTAWRAFMQTDSDVTAAYHAVLAFSRREVDSIRYVKQDYVDEVGLLDTVTVVGNRQLRLQISMITERGGRLMFEELPNYCGSVVRPVQKKGRSVEPACARTRTVNLKTWSPLFDLRRVSVKTRATATPGNRGPWWMQ